MTEKNKFMDMLVNYASAHQNNINILFHLIGIPTIMLGINIPLSWINFDILGYTITAAHIITVGLFLFYLTLDTAFSVVFLIMGLIIAEYAILLSVHPSALSIAALAFFGGYALQFVGHAIEKSMPVLIKHPIQANLAAPFFVIVEIFGILRLRKALFEEINTLVDQHREKDKRLN